MDRLPDFAHLQLNKLLGAYSTMSYLAEDNTGADPVVTPLLERTLALQPLLLSLKL
jgi:hypothetical protein